MSLALSFHPRFVENFRCQFIQNNKIDLCLYIGEENYHTNSTYKVHPLPSHFFACDERYTLNQQSASFLLLLLMGPPMLKIFVYRTFNLIHFLLRFIFGTVSNKMHQCLGAYLQLQFLLFIITGDRRLELHQICCSCDAVLLKVWCFFGTALIPRPSSL